MRLKVALLSAASALVLSAGAAAAAPAVAESSVNLRAGPGTQYPVVDTIPGGAAVDVAGCTGSWCRVNFNGEIGYASRNYLQLAGGPTPGAGVVVVAPGFVDDEPIYDYYDYGYTYGPTFGFYANPGYRHRHGWRGHWEGNRVGTWHGRAGWSGGRSGNRQGNRTGTWQGRTGAPTGGARIGSAGGVSRGGGMAPGSVAPQVSAPAGMGGGAAAGGGAAVGGAPAGGAGGGSARAQGR